MMFHARRVRNGYASLIEGRGDTLKDVREALDLKMSWYARSTRCVTARELLGGRCRPGLLRHIAKGCDFCAYVVKWLHYCHGMSDDEFIALLRRAARRIGVAVTELHSDLKTGPGEQCLTFEECFNAASLVGERAEHRDNHRYCRAFLALIAHMPIPRLM